MSPSPLVITKADGTQVDHIGLACRDLQEGVQYFRDKTGIELVIHKAREDVPYQNATVRIGDTSFLEILGPNAAYKGINPLRSLLKRFSEPTLWFWFVGTNDFDALEKSIRDAGRCTERKIEGESGTDSKLAYVRASIGPGFWSVYPNVIQWKGSVKEHHLKDLPIVPIKNFSVIVGQDFETIKEFFKSVGIDGSYLQASTDNKSYLSLTIETPDKGPVTFKSEADSVSTWTVIKTLLMDLMGFL